MSVIEMISWVCQLYLAFFFARSAYRKVKNYQRVREEFRGWGYPLPGIVTGFLVCIWIICAFTILIPPFAGLAAVVLLAFMLVAFATLLWNREIWRLIEPCQPILVLFVVITVRHKEIAAIIF